MRDSRKSKRVQLPVGMATFIVNLPADEGIHAVKGKKGFQPVPKSKQKGNVVGTSITDAEKEVLQAIADMQGVTISRILRRAIRQYIKEQALPAMSENNEMQYSLFEDE